MSDDSIEVRMRAWIHAPARPREPSGDEWLDRWLPTASVPNSTHNLAGPIHVEHLTMNEGRDESETWCGGVSYRSGQSSRPEDVSCRACLVAASEYAQRVALRLEELS